MSITKQPIVKIIICTKCLSSNTILDPGSLNPEFVSFMQVFLGQKYGYRPLPTHIEATEFESLRDVAKNVQSELELLDQWYKKDDNSVPAYYILQPISSIFQHFNNKVSASH